MGEVSQEMVYSLRHPSFGIVSEESCFQGTFFSLEPAFVWEKSLPLCCAVKSPLSKTLRWSPLREVLAAHLHRIANSVREA